MKKSSKILKTKIKKKELIYGYDRSYQWVKKLVACKRTASRIIFKNLYFTVLVFCKNTADNGFFISGLSVIVVKSQKINPKKSKINC